METAGIHHIREYIRRWKATIAKRVACRPIYELYSKADWMVGTTQMVRWWDQDRSRQRLCVI